MRLGVLLALVGGGLDAYTFISRGGVFAGAQTGNVVLLGVAAAQRHWWGVCTVWAACGVPAVGLCLFVHDERIARRPGRPGGSAGSCGPGR